MLLVVLAAIAAAPAMAADFTFGAPTRLTLAWNYERSVAIGDVNGDGRPDLAIAEDLTTQVHDVSVLLQQADGSLAPPITLTVSSDFGFGIASVAVADLDGDGAAEILVGSTHLQVVRLAGGTLVATDAGAAKYSCYFLATGDIDGDGNADVVCHSDLGTPTAATMFYGDGHGGFRATAEMQTDVGSYGYYADFMSMRLADVTGDGRPDLLVSASRISSFYVYANDGHGGFFSTGTAYVHPMSPSGVFPSALTVLDVDGDGTNEVVTANPDDEPDGRVNLYRLGDNGLLVLSKRYPVHSSTTALLAADLDRDGRDELVAGHFGYNAASVLDLDTAADLARQRQFDMPGFAYGLSDAYPGGMSKALAIGDLDGDGCADLAVASSSGAFLLPGCQPQRRRTPRNDFDGDGVSDLLWQNTVTREFIVWQWADIDLWKTCPYPCPVYAVPPWSMGATGDFDGDGTTDTFWRNQQDGNNAYITAAYFTRPIAAVANLAWEVVATGDFDGDDRSDLLWRNRRTGANVTWGGADRASRLDLRTVADLDYRVAGTGDFDGDGHSEILWRHAKKGTDVIWALSGRRDTRRVLPTINLQWEVQGIGDFDGDGKDDVFWRNTVTGANTIWPSADRTRRRVVPGVGNLDWNVGAVGDYNGDGRSDLAWHNRTTFANTIWLSANPKTKQDVVATVAEYALMP
jgi:hypothetical protein